ncbi:hypothetical protein ACSV5M_00010 [Cellvibrio sp. ARAG 10.3]|uniref:hypothetical protein n=1 Tax=Cellvibrio sp. ARAG 10.3 TaxID=3451358 RepID=UPI003F45E8AC
MKNRKRQISYFLLALLSGFVVWYSLGAVPSCAHFDVHGFCKELMSRSSNGEVTMLVENCIRLANASAELCDYVHILGMAAMVLGLTTLFLSIRRVIHASLEKNCSDGNL